MSTSDIISALAVVVSILAGGFGVYRYFWPRVKLKADLTEFASGVVGITWIVGRVTIYNCGRFNIAISEAHIVDSSSKPAKYCSDLQNHDVSLPVSIEVGKHWSGDLETALPNLSIDVLRVKIIHSESRKPYYCRIRKRLDHHLLDEIDTLRP